MAPEPIQLQAKVQVQLEVQVQCGSCCRSRCPVSHAVRRAPLIPCLPC